MINATIFLLSAAILAYEVALMRMFSIAQWHHFAAMIISIALLGFGLSGTVLSIWRERLRGSFGSWALGFVLTVPVCTWLAQSIPFTPMLIVWQPRQILYLFGVYLLLTIPFTCGALAIGLALTKARESGSVGKMYSMNLLGSGVGAVAGLALCYLPLPARISEYKGLPKAMAMADARTVWTAHHPLGRVDVVECPALRVAPGLSLAYTGSMPTQQVVFVDSDGGSAVSREGSPHLEWLPSAAPYQLRTMTDVLILGVGGGTELQQARQLGAGNIVGVELHPRVAGLIRAGNVVVTEGRAFIRQSGGRFDLIQISLLDSLAATATGVGAANETYLYTIEAFHDFQAHLSDDGVLCITRWLKNPPRDEIKLFATAVEALERAGVPDPGAHLMFVRGWATGTLLVKRTPFSAEEIARVRTWADKCAFDVDYFPGASERDVNQRNVMAEPVYFQSAKAILSGDRENFFRDSLFNLRPATDNRPYFFHFFRWRNAPHLLRTMGKEWVPFVEWGYVVAVATLVQAVVASVVLIGLPVVVRGSKLGRGSVFVYFACLGLGFMFLEMALLQEFVLFLGNPLFSAAVVIASFLVFAGLGSAQAGKRVRDARLPATVIVVIALAYVPGLPVVFRWLLAAPEPVRVAATIVLLGPLAFFMGLMFPLGLSRISPSLLPWAWGVNGCFSVIGAALASVLAMDFGFAAVIIAAAGLYTCAGANYRKLGPGLLQ